MGVRSVDINLHLPSLQSTTFRERAEASMRDAMSTATELASSAMENVKVMSDTVTHDMKILAQDARQKAKALTDENEEAPTGPRPRDVGINERLIGAVQSLSYASFADRENSASNGEEGEELAQWQLHHAQVILKECPELESLRFALCPKRMSEHNFWTTYFLLVNDFLDKGGGSAGAAGTPGGSEESPGLSADGGKSTTAPSALTAWEDVQRDEAGSAPSPDTAAEPGDDLDKYLQDMLDGDGTGAHDHVGTSEGGDLDEYLKELDEGGADGAGGNGAVDFDDVDEYLGELNLSDDDAGESSVAGTPETASNAAK